MKACFIEMRSCLVLAIASFLVGGCETAPPIENDVRDPSVYARSTNTRVVRAIKGISKEPATAQQRVDQLVKTLAKYPNAPIGDNEATYAELLEAARALQQKVGARAESLQPEIDALRSIADRLIADSGTPDS